MDDGAPKVLPEAKVEDAGEEAGNNSTTKPVVERRAPNAAEMGELIIENRKRTYMMFASDMDAPLVEDPTLVKMKVRAKVDAFYS